MHYEVLDFSIVAGQTAPALIALETSLLRDTRSTLYACWYREIGEGVGDILAIRGFEDMRDLEGEQQRSTLRGDVFGLSGMSSGLERCTYRRFDFLDEMRMGKMGPFFEVRVYDATMSGVGPTMELWKEYLEHRTSISPLLTAMYRADRAPPRILHVWPYPSLDARQALRAKSLSSGKWPPIGSLDHLTRFRSSIYLPASFSPIC